jgi:hypothetical protein
VRPKLFFKAHAALLAQSPYCLVTCVVSDSLLLIVYALCF